MDGLSGDHKLARGQTDSGNAPAFLPVILAPTFNNASTLREVLWQVQSAGVPVIVVDDGSTDDTPAVLRNYPAITVLRHPANCGKAGALHTGFARARRLGFTHVLTIDSDGQHDPAEIGGLLEIARRSPQALVLGTRSAETAGYPWRSKFGRSVSNSLVWMESGLKVIDTQCGYRVYPIELVNSVPCAAARYAYETEILTRAAWNHWEVVQIDVACRYFQGEARVSHFRPFLDSAQVLLMHGRLLPLSLWQWIKRGAAPLMSKERWRQWRATPEGRNRIAGGLAVGVFFACQPFYGVQAVLSVVLARMLRLNYAAALLGSQLSMPPLSVALIAGAFGVGHLLLHGNWPGQDVWHVAHASTRLLSAPGHLLMDWMVGSVVLGTTLGVFTYFTARAALALRAAPSA